MQFVAGESEPKLACTGDQEVDLFGVANTLELHIVNVQLEGYAFVGGSVGLERFEAVQSDQKHGHHTTKQTQYRR